MATDKRRVDQDPDRHPVVTEKGLIKLIPVGAGINSALGIDDDGDVFVKPEYTKLGWVLLKDLYKSESKVKEWKLYKQYMQLRQKGMIPEGSDSDKVKEPHERSFPDKYLPSEVLKRRQGKSKSKSGKIWTPDLESLDQFEDSFEQEVQEKDEYED